MSHTVSKVVFQLALTMYYLNQIANPSLTHHLEVRCLKYWGKLLFDSGTSRFLNSTEKLSFSIRRNSSFFLWLVYSALIALFL
jgi:hypothetical protein